MLYSSKNLFKAAAKDISKKKKEKKKKTSSSKALAAYARSSCNLCNLNDTPETSV